MEYKFKNTDLVAQFDPTPVELDEDTNKYDNTIRLLLENETEKLWLTDHSVVHDEILTEEVFLRYCADMEDRLKKEAHEALSLYRNLEVSEMEMY
jgi:hypothetical protein